MKTPAEWYGQAGFCSGCKSKCGQESVELAIRRVQADALLHAADLVEKGGAPEAAKPLRELAGRV